MLSIGAWFTSKGGFALHNPQEEASLKVSCFVLPTLTTSSDSVNSTAGQNSSATATTTGNNSATTSSIVSDCPTDTTNSWLGESIFETLDTLRSKPYTSLLYTFNETINMFGPNDFFILQKSLQEDMGSVPLKTVR